MQVTVACKSLLEEVGDVIEQINNEHFSMQIDVLNGSTLGQHFRHTLEFFQCLLSGYNTGVVCYDKRDHDAAIESDKDLALAVLAESIQFLESCELDRPVKVAVCYDADSEEEFLVDSNIAREITYNIEHAIHHMALIKIGVKAICPYVVLPNGFGIAVSTLKHQKKQSVG